MAADLGWDAAVAGPSKQYDAIIVGGGLAGLCAAYRLVVQEKRSAILLEAQPRVGGRAFQEEIEIDGKRYSFDLGASYVGTNQHPLIEFFAKDLGLNMSFGDPNADVVPVRAAGKAITYLNGDRLFENPEEDIPSSGLDLFSRLGLKIMFLRLDHFVNVMKEHVERPWEAPDAERWDDWSVEDFLKSDLFFTAKDEEMLRMAVRAIWSVEPAEVSFLYFLWYAAAAGSLTSLLDNQGEGAAQGYFLRDGAQVVCERLARSLGGAVRLGQPVRRIEQDGAGVTVFTQGGLQFRADRAIVATSPFVSCRIEYDPPLPPARVQLVQRMPLGRTIKCIAVYDEAYWHGEFSGMSVGNSTPVIWTMDHTVPPGPPALMAFVVADHADRLCQRPAAEIERIVCEAMAETFDDPRLRLPRRFLFKDWSADPWACGGPTGVTPPGALTAFGHALRKPFGRVHWSGTEAATKWVGYMCGAIAAGLAAADEVLAAGG
jgi:monoamine oxidase